MRKSLFEFLLEKQKLKTITLTEQKVMKFYLQVYLLMQYFDIAANYCKTKKIQAEVVEKYPSWTGYENYAWYTYHYESFGNALYSYTQACKSILNFLKKKYSNFPKDGETYLSDFITDPAINKILKERHDSVHQFGEWRSKIIGELRGQNWKSAEDKIVPVITEARDKAKIFELKIIDFINMQMQLKLFNENLGKASNSKELAKLKKKFSFYDPSYVALSTMTNRSDFRDWIESIWEQYQPYADTNFPNEFKKQFSQRSWELHLGSTLLNRGYTLGSHSNTGPDFKIPYDGKSIWIEAIAVEKGDGQDQVPNIEYGKEMDVPEKEMLLRLTAGLREKHLKYLSYLNNNFVSQNDPFVIAINRSPLELSLIHI